MKEGDLVKIDYPADPCGHKIGLVFFTSFDDIDDANPGLDWVACLVDGNPIEPYSLTQCEVISE